MAGMEGLQEGILEWGCGWEEGLFSKDKVPGTFSKKKWLFCWVSKDMRCVFFVFFLTRMWLVVLWLNKHWVSATCYAPGVHKIVRQTAQPRWVHINNFSVHAKCSMVKGYACDSRNASGEVVIWGSGGQGKYHRGSGFWGVKMSLPDKQGEENISGGGNS